MTPLLRSVRLLPLLFVLGCWCTDTSSNVACCVLAFLIDEGGDVGRRVARALATRIDEGFCAGVSPYWAEFLTTQAMSTYVPPATLQVCVKLPG